MVWRERNLLRINTEKASAVRSTELRVRAQSGDCGDMIRILKCVAFVPLVTSIIVRDPPLKPSEYKYSYDIRDPTTGDSKSQLEEKYGDVVKGSYTVLDPDGTRRTVLYTADPEKGFNAVIRTEPATVESVSYVNDPTNNVMYRKYQQNQYVPQVFADPLRNYKNTPTPQENRDLYTYPYHYYTKNDDDLDERHLFAAAQKSRSTHLKEPFFSFNSHLFEPVQKSSYY